MIEQVWRDPSTNWFAITYYNDDWSGYECVFGFDIIKVYNITVKENTYKSRKKYEINKENHIYKAAIANLFNPKYKPFRVELNLETIYKRQ